MSTASTGADASADEMLRFGVLGPLEVWQGARLIDLPGRKERALLALLLTAPGRVFSVPAIVEGIWGDAPPGRAEHTLQSYVSRLRRALPGGGASVVLTRSPGYLAAVDAAQVDAERFRVLPVDGRRELRAGRFVPAAATLREALGLWRGDAYAEFDAPFATAERSALEELRLAAVEDRIAAELALGAGAEFVGELETLVAQHPWRERLWAQLMTALYRSGRQRDALNAFQRARTSLVDELGVEPGPALRVVEAQVLAQDVQLLGERPPSDLPPALTAVGPTFVGREAELARLLEAYDRAASGAIERVLLIGPHGIGKTRLLAEFAREAQARGGLVSSSAGDVRPPAGAPHVVLLDDLQRTSTAELAALAELVGAARAPLLVVGACVPDRHVAGHHAVISRMFPERLSVPALSSSDIVEIVRLYVPVEAVEDGVAAVAGAAGVPLQVHAAASRYGEQLAAAQVGEAAAGISGPRRRLSASQDRVAGGVLDLQRIRLVRTAHEPVVTPTVTCPYKGLASFDVDDAPYFFGRERLVAQLVARLVDARLLAVVGASGSGKSSVLRAGLVAAVRAGTLPGSEWWHTVLTTPTQRRPDLADPGRRTLLVVDQFEEMFTALSPGQRTAYAQWLSGAAAGDDVAVVVAVRSDYYAQAAAYPRVSDLLAANTVLVGEMTAEERVQAVELPAVAAGLELESGLAETIAGDVAGQPGGLPLMSTALLSLWERRDGRRLTLAAYHDVGGVRRAVTQLAETAYGRLTPRQQSVARRTLLRLAEIGDGGEPVRRRVPIAEVAPDGDADARAVLDALAARRLLTVSEAHVTVAHEALLRAWPRLRGWLDDDESGRRLRRHLAPAARDWQAGGRDASELYRGPRLAAALEWQREHPEDLTETEHGFLRASRDESEAEALRRRRSIRRLRGLAVGLTSVLLLAVVAGVIAVDQRNDAARASLAADVRALHATALDEHRWDRALLYAAQAQRFEPSADSRAALLQTIQRSPEATAVLRADQPLQALAASADGTRVLASGTNGTVYVWDAQTGRLVHAVPDVTAFWADSLDISPDGRYIAAVGLPAPFFDEVRPWTFHVNIIDLAQTPPAVRVLEDAPASAARFTADGRTLVTVDDDEGRVRYVDVERGTVERTLDDEVAGPLLDGPDNRRFMVASGPWGDGQVAVWEVGTGSQVWSSDESEGAVAAISPDGSALVIGHADGRVERVDLSDDGARETVPSSLVDGLIDVAWAPDGSTFAGATQERTVLVWDAGTLEPVAVLRGHWGNVTQMAYSADGATMYASGSDRTVLAWDLTGTKGIVSGVGGRPAAGAMHTMLAPDGSVAATTYADGRVEVFDSASGETFHVSIPTAPDWAGWMNVDRLGRYVLVHVERGSREGPWHHATIHVVDVERREVLPSTIEYNMRTAQEAAVTWDGRAIVAGAERRVAMWDLATGQPLSPRLFEAAEAVADVRVHPDGRLAALSGYGGAGAIEIIDLTTGALVATLPRDGVSNERLPLSPMAFSPDGRWLAAAAWSGHVGLWDTRSWRLHSVWEAITGFRLDSLVFTPDSNFLISGGAGAASIWNVEQGAGGGVTVDVDPLRPETSVAVGTSDDGRTLVTFTAGTGVREWIVEPARLLEHACAVAGRNLTRQEWEDVLPARPYEATCPEHPSG